MQSMPEGEGVGWGEGGGGDVTFTGMLTAACVLAVWHASQRVFNHNSKTYSKLLDLFVVAFFLCHPGYRCKQSHA